MGGRLPEITAALDIGVTAEHPLHRRQAYGRMPGKRLPGKRAAKSLCFSVETAPGSGRQEGLHVPRQSEKRRYKDEKLRFIIIENQNQ